MAFAVKQTNVDGLDSYLKTLVVGEANAGKLEFAATFPQPLFLTTHTGLPALKEQAYPFVTLDSSKTLLDLKVCLEQTPEIHRGNLGFSPETVVLDSVDGVQRLFARERLLSTRKTNLEGEDYGWLGDQMDGILLGLRNLDMHIVLLASQKEVNGIIKPALVGRTVDGVFDFPDYAFHQTARVRYVVEENAASTRVVYALKTVPDSVYPWIHDESSVLPAEFVLDFENDFERLMECVGQPYDVVLDAPVLVPTQPEIEQTPVVSAPEPTAPVVAAPEPEPDRSVTDVAAQLLTQEAKAEPITIEGKYACEKCGVVFDDEDEADMGVIKFRATLCSSCYDARIKENQ